MCCACKVPSTDVTKMKWAVKDTKARVLEECLDTSRARDSGGDTCSWYYGNEELCGDYDDDDFAASSCCACHGTRSRRNCLDTSYGARDSGLDSCSWYMYHQESCGEYDSELFNASLMCCSCGGGSGSDSDTEHRGSCTDTSYGVLNSENNSCLWY